LNQVTRGDLLLFKEEILQTIKVLKTELNNKIKEKLESYNKLVESSNQKLYNYEVDKKTFLSNVLL
jgi:meiotically up-regulated gene 157 (Mug157) protein